MTPFLLTRRVFRSIHDSIKCQNGSHAETWTQSKSSTMSSSTMSSSTISSLKIPSSKMSSSTMSSLMTSQEVAAALRPFFFVVHPDKFWQHPKEKDTNENSLKQLNAFLENLMERKKTNATRITFYVRDNNKESNVNQMNRDNQQQKHLRQVHIDLSQRDDVNSAVYRILSECRLSTEYLVKIGKQPKIESNDTQSSDKMMGQKKFSGSEQKFSGYRGNLQVFWMKNQNEAQTDAHEFQRFVNRKREVNSIEWLRENAGKAQDRINACRPIREEVKRLSEELKNQLSLKELVWDCGWSASHIRGCLLSLKTLKMQHSNDMKALIGKTVVYGRQTGVSLDGHIILNIEDVRHNWLELIRNIEKYDSFLESLPFAEGVLSGSLRGIRIDHRKFKPAVMIQKYIQQLNKLTSALGEHFVEHEFPQNWPQSLSKYELVVESEAGPLMLSPTGQFIVPASCPGFLLLDFIGKNMTEASRLLEMYKSAKIKEIDIINHCLTAFGLESIEKDDNITPHLMIECCHMLLKNKNSISRFLRGSRLRVSHYHSVLLDGEICIPWNIKL